MGDVLEFNACSERDCEPVTPVTVCRYDPAHRLVHMPERPPWGDDLNHWCGRCATATMGAFRIAAWIRDGHCTDADVDMALRMRCHVAPSGKISASNIMRAAHEDLATIQSVGDYAWAHARERVARENTDRQRRAHEAAHRALDHIAALETCALLGLPLHRPDGAKARVLAVAVAGGCVAVDIDEPWARARGHARVRLRCRAEQMTNPITRGLVIAGFCFIYPLGQRDLMALWTRACKALLALRGHAFVVSPATLLAMVGAAERARIDAREAACAAATAKEEEELLRQWKRRSRSHRAGKTDVTDLWESAWQRQRPPTGYAPPRESLSAFQWELLESLRRTHDVPRTAVLTRNHQALQAAGEPAAPKTTMKEAKRNKEFGRAK